MDGCWSWAVRQRRVLAALLLSPDRMVPIAGWSRRLGRRPAGDGRAAGPQPGGGAAVVLTRHGGLIDTVDSGYRIRVGRRGALDLAVFDELVARDGRT